MIIATWLILRIISEQLYPNWEHRVCGVYSNEELRAGGCDVFWLSLWTNATPSDRCYYGIAWKISGNLNCSIIYQNMVFYILFRITS